MDDEENKLKVSLEERIFAAMDRFYKTQVNNKKRPLLRRKNNLVRGSQIPIKGAINGQ